MEGQRSHGTSEGRGAGVHTWKAHAEVGVGPINAKRSCVGPTMERWPSQASQHEDGGAARVCTVA